VQPLHEAVNDAVVASPAKGVGHAEDGRLDAEGVRLGRREGVAGKFRGSVPEDRLEGRVVLEVATTGEAEANTIRGTRAVRQASRARQVARMFPWMGLRAFPAEPDIVSAPRIESVPCDVRHRCRFAN